MTYFEALTATEEYRGLTLEHLVAPGYCPEDFFSDSINCIIPNDEIANDNTKYCMECWNRPCDSSELYNVGGRDKKETILEMHKKEMEMRNKKILGEAVQTKQEESKQKKKKGTAVFDVEAFNKKNSESLIKSHKELLDKACRYSKSMTESALRKKLCADMKSTEPCINCSCKCMWGLAWLMKKGVTVTQDGKEYIFTEPSETGEVSAVNNIIMIDINKIDPHPDNPRKDLGDLTELAESIKVNGVMQNLTVVPWFSKTTRQPADSNKMDGHYVALIGHRRLAAAKQAGLKEVPCAVIDGLSQSEQIGIMLAENMQRSDLTVIEQADSIQMMLDLGDTVDSIAEKTGFSKSTIDRRLKIISYGHDKVKAAFERGATLADFDELKKIDDPDRRDKLLKSIGTNNFNWELKCALNEIESSKLERHNSELLESFAEKVESGEGFKFVKDGTLAHDKQFQKPDDTDTVKYYYVMSKYGYYRLYREMTDEERRQAANAENEKQERERHIKEQAEWRNKLGRLEKQAYELRCVFLQDMNPLSGCKGLGATLERYIKFHEFLVRAIFNEYLYQGFDEPIVDMAKALEIYDDSFDDLDADEQYDIVTGKCSEKNVSAFKQLIILVVSTIDKDLTYHDWKGVYQKNEQLDFVYEVLCYFGYELSDEETALMNGTHEAFNKKAEE